ncbi:hypothetical protein ACHAPT_008893 [Fusarium lateritium]
MNDGLPCLEFSEFIVGGIIAGEYAESDQKVDISFEYNGKQIILSVFASPRQETGDEDGEERLEDQMIRDLGEAADIGMDDPEAFEAVVDNIAETIMDIGAVPFSKIAPPLTVPFFPPTDLHSTLYRELFNFRLQTIGGKELIFPISPEEADKVRTEYEPDPNLSFELPGGIELPKYSSRDIMIQEEYFGGILSAGKARVGSQTLFCKAFASGINNMDLDKEVVTPHKIYQACANAGIQIRIPLLKGYAVHADSGAILGFLRDFVHPGHYGGTLSEIRLRDVPRKMRKKWLDQIRETTELLHSFGLFWGDGKAVNAVINQNNDAWLIDFAGGWTNGWVDKKDTGTMEGENQALRRMTTYLGFSC